VEDIMTVAELIKQLQELPQDLTVVRGDADWGFITLKERARIVDIEKGDSTHGWTTEVTDWHDSECEYYPAVKIA
jgi:hypothetical protein